MVFKVDFFNGTVVKWSKGGVIEKDRDYNPSFFISRSSDKELGEMEEFLLSLPQVVDVSYVRKRTGWRKDYRKVLKVDVNCTKNLMKAVSKASNEFRVGEYRFFNVDFSSQHRYFLETSTKPSAENLDVQKLTIPRKQLDNGNISKVGLDNRLFRETEEKNLEEIKNQLKEKDPDLLVLNSSEIIPLIDEKAEEYGFTGFPLGRASGIEKLAEKSSYNSYGVQKHSPSRYNVPGRAVIDLSNSFFINHTGLYGLEKLVKQSWKPIQEASWASIGNILTAIQVKYALSKDVLVPWQAWRHEMVKTASTLHRSDRGGFIFSPRTGVHKDVFECDFSSLYPNIIVERNISPETVRCSCCENSEVPGLDYSVCEKEGYLGKVLEPLIRDRDVIKKRLKDENLSKKEEEELKSHSDAIKWILVSCFGYQGYNNAKFGRIECHESINAYAREIMLEAKEVFERNGYKVVHGIVDSLWIKKKESSSSKECKSVKKICKQVSRSVGIKLELEAEYDWIAFCPRKKQVGGALNKYFGKRKDGSYKFRGIELRRSSTPKYIKNFQRQLIKRIKDTENIDSLVKFVKKSVNSIENGKVPVNDLIVSKRVTKRPEEYKQDLKSVSAVKRAKIFHSVDYSPGETVDYVVVDSSKRGVGRVKNPFYEDVNCYDEIFYVEKVLEAAESVLSSLGLTDKELRKKVRNVKELGLQAFSPEIEENL